MAPKHIFRVKTFTGDSMNVTPVNFGVNCIFIILLYYSYNISNNTQLIM